MYVKQLSFLQGDDASDFFRLLYPTGMQFRPQDGIRHMLDTVSEDIEIDRQEPQILDKYDASGMFITRYHVLTWSYAYNWVALYLRVTKKELKASGWKEQRVLVKN